MDISRTAKLSAAALSLVGVLGMVSDAVSNWSSFFEPESSAWFALATPILGALFGLVAKTRHLRLREFRIRSLGLVWWLAIGGLTAFFSAMAAPYWLLKPEVTISTGMSNSLEKLGPNKLPVLYARLRSSVDRKGLGAATVRGWCVCVRFGAFGANPAINKTWDWVATPPLSEPTCDESATLRNKIPVLWGPVYNDAVLLPTAQAADAEILKTACGVSPRRGFDSGDLRRGKPLVISADQQGRSVPEGTNKVYYRVAVIITGLNEAQTDSKLGDL